MPVYLDDARIPHRVNHIMGKWSHLMPIPVTEETLTELHQIAHEIGLKVNWFQEGSWPHYDITESKREAAIKAGALPITTQELAKIRLAEKRKRRGSDEMENR